MYEQEMQASLLECAKQNERGKARGHWSQFGIAHDEDGPPNWQERLVPHKELESRGLIEISKTYYVELEDNPVIVWEYESIEDEAEAEQFYKENFPCKVPVYTGYYRLRHAS